MRFIEWLYQHEAILFGLALGAVAHVGRKLSEGEKLTCRSIVGYFMQLGVVGLIASVSTKQMGIVDGDMRALVTAILAISAQEVLQYLKKSGWIYPVNSALPRNKD